jgi:hypothetical protein
MRRKKGKNMESKKAVIIEGELIIEAELAKLGEKFLYPDLAHVCDKKEKYYVDSITATGRNAIDHMFKHFVDDYPSNKLEQVFLLKLKTKKEIFFLVKDYQGNISISHKMIE